MIDHDALVHSAYKLPPLPQSAVRLASLVASNDTDLGEIVQVIECDPVLTIKLLRVANSVFSSPGRPIGTVKGAVIRLGTEIISGLVTNACVQPLMGKMIPGYNLSGAEFWRHSLTAALAAEATKSYSPERLSPLAFTAALLHDIGKFVLGHFLSPETLCLLERAAREGKQAAFQAEIEILSLHHGEVGGVVAQHWGLPEIIVKGITYHHNPEDCEDVIGYVTHLANMVAHGLEAQTPARSASMVRMAWRHKHQPAAPARAVNKQQRLTRQALHWNIWA